MFRGKTTCKVLKEVRRKIADANGIPLSERECTHKGDCAGTCPYCESEVRYLERELSKRKCLGKVVAVAGIALSAVTMAGCATSEPVSSDSANKPSKTSGRDITNALSWMGAVVVDDDGKPAARNPEKNKLKKEKRQKNFDTLQLRGIVLDMDESRHDTAQKEITFDESLLLDTEEDKHETDKDKVVIGLVDDWGSQNWNVNEERPAPESIPGFTPAVFTEGKLEDWLGEHLTQFQTYMQELRVDSVEICFFVEEDGTVSLINIQNMPEVYEPKDEAFRAKVVAVISGTEWKPATVSDKPVSSIVTVLLRDLR
ncbi:MAG: hypothetical protein IJK22_07330 [Bacteroidales bacterium]|nr:hypothetical protein [Bacteroidales bacterium]